ncbi:hypothetical protein THOD04_30359 [Vibrio owensii]|uniref:Uncharacterized protein n=1 Tax=Vibrio owensii TaxID=696485 RepID=A0AAU9PXT2_9VIBR|nr:hypothetical protein THF1D04_10483 [Vibrio owensii]CAH1588249.1 hypothetical protein THOD04_30359 [Vibrio owensii]
MDIKTDHYANEAYRISTKLDEVQEQMDKQRENTKRDSSMWIVAFIAFQFLLFYWLHF